MKSSPTTTVKVVYTGPTHVFDVKVDLGFASSLPSGNIDAASRMLQFSQDFTTTLNVSITWTRSDSVPLPPPYRAELTAVQTTQGVDDSTRQDCPVVDKPTGFSPGVSTITKALTCRWSKIPVFLDQDTLPAEVRQAIGLPPDRPLVVFQSVADFQVFAANGSHADGFTVMAFTYYTTSPGSPPPPATAKLDPSVVFPKDSGGSWPLTLTTASAPDITAVKFGTLPSAAIAGRDAQSLKLTQAVPSDTKPGRYQLTVTQKGQSVNLPVYLYVAGIEILDPNPGLLSAAGTVNFSAASLAAGVFTLPRRSAVSADGVTQVLLRIPSDQPMSVQVLGEKAGAVQPMDDTPSSSAYATPVADPEVGSAVFVLYTPPKDLAKKTNPGQYDFGAPDDLNAPAPNDPGTQTVPVRVTVVPSSGAASAVVNDDSIRKHRALTLVRPPMLLMHGIWSNRTVWSTDTGASPPFDTTVQRLTGARWVGAADYEPYHARSFDPRRARIEGIEALKSELQATLGHYRDAGIAATQVDVVGHSMGGIMTRVFSQRKTEYLRKNNFMQGDVHKLVTLDTPHSGSLFVLYLWNNRDQTLLSYPAEAIHIDDLTIRFNREVERVTVGTVFEAAHMPIDEGAVENFRPCSDAIKAIDASPIPTHAVSGLRPDNVSTNFFAKIIFNIASASSRILKSVDDVIGHKEHDVIVEAESMRAGLPYASLAEDPFSRPAHDQPNVIHSYVADNVEPMEVSVVGNPDTQKIAAAILRSPVDEGNVFRALSAPRDVRSAPWHATSVTGSCDPADSSYIKSAGHEAPQALPRSAAEPRASGPYLEIVSPAIGAVYAPGDTVTVTAVGRNGLQPQNVFFYGMPDSPVQSAAGALQATMRIPANYAGNNRIEVYGADGNGTLYRGVTIIVVRPSKPLSNLTVSPQTLRFTYATQIAQLSPVGRYADGTTVSLYDDSDVQFSSSNPGVASVSATGKVQAVGAGSASIRVTLGGVSSRISVDVSISNTPPVFDAVTAMQVAAGQSRSVSLKATSPMGNQVTLRAVSLPAFAAFTPSGNTGVLRLSPQSANVGDYQIEFAADDNGDPPLSEALVVNVKVLPAAAGGGPAPIISSGGIGNAADLQATLTPGGLASIFGASLADGVAQASQVPWPRLLGSTEVTVNGQDAPLYFVSPQQVNFQVPFEVPTQGTIEIAVLRNGVASAAVKAPVAQYAPAIFQAGADPVVVHTDFQLVSAARPAQAGEVLIVYATGVGGVTNQPSTGAATSASPLPSAKVTPTVTVGGAAADVLFAGLAPYFVGVAQFNIRLPAALPAGSRLPLVIAFGGSASKPVNLAVQPSAPVTVMLSDSFNRANADKCSIGKADLSLGGSGTHYYVPVFSGAAIVSGALQNNGQAYGGVQLTSSSSPCSAWGESIGQDLNIKIDLLLPTDSAGHVSQGGPYLRARSAYTNDGILGGESAGYWIQLHSTGEIKIKNLNSAAIIAASAKPASFDAGVFHTLEVSARGTALQASLDGQLVTFTQNGSNSGTVSIPATGGSNNGAAGIAFASEPNQGAIGGQRARNLVVTAFRSLSGASAQN